MPKVNMSAKASAKANMSDVLAAVSKKYGTRVGSINDLMVEEVSIIPTGNIAVDHILGVGGLPIGRSIELYGRPSSGKTSLSLQAAAELQRRIIAENTDEYILYSDYEHALDLSYCKSLGLDLEHPSFLLMQPDDFESGSNSALEIIKTGKVRLAIWDSVAAMTPSHMLDAEVGSAQVALRARLMSDLMVKMNPIIHEHNTCAVFLNHEMELMATGGMGGAKRYSTPGGRALKFYASVRLEFRPIGNIKGSSEDELTGQDSTQVTASDVRVRVVKNKVAAPFREAVLRVRFGRGFDNFWTALQILIAHKKITAKVGFYHFPGVPELEHVDMQGEAGKSFVRGEENLMEFADSHPEWRQQVIEAAARQLRELKSATD